MARNMEIREIPNVGTAVVPGVVCVGDFVHMYGYIAGTDDVLPKKVGRKAKKARNTQKSSVTVPVHSKPDQVCLGRQCSCKKVVRPKEESKLTSGKRFNDIHGLEGSARKYSDRGRNQFYKNQRRMPMIQLTA